MKPVNSGLGEGNNTKIPINIVNRICHTFRSDMFSFGQSPLITIAPGTELHIEFSIKQIDNMKTKERKCIEDKSYSATECFKKYLETKTHCRISWFNSSNYQTGCSSESLASYFHFLIDLKQQTTANITQDSGCFSKCRTRQYIGKSSLKKKELLFAFRRSFKIPKFFHWTGLL